MTFSALPTTDPASVAGTAFVLDHAMPGGHIAWTVTRRLAGASSPLELLDTLGDGQQFDPGFAPVVTATIGGTTTYSGSVAYSVRAESAGVSQLAFDLSAVPLAGADTVSVTFHSVIASALAAGGIGTALSQGDTLDNSAVLQGQSGAADSEAVTLPQGSLTASVYAVNGVVQSGTATPALGDLVTYRLRLHLPLSTAQQVQIAVAAPGGSEPISFVDATEAVPDEGSAQWGPDATYTDTVPDVSSDGIGNLLFDFGDLQPVYGAGASEIDVLFTTLLDGVSGTGPVTLEATETEANSFGVQSNSLAELPVALATPTLTLQTASLFDTGDHSLFVGSGGPWGYDPFFGQFAGVVSSAGLDAQPFRDQLWDIEAGDQVVFVLAVQNRADRAAAYDVVLRDTMPQGFVVPDDGAGISVTDGAGNPLDFTGDLFDQAGGLRLTDPVAGYDPDSGANVVLVTFALQAAASIPVPLAGSRNGAAIVSYAGLPDGADLAPGAAPGTLADSTPVTTADLQAQVAADQSIVSLPSGRTASFDVTVTVPAGEVRDLRIDEVLPHTGDAWLRIVSAELVHFGADLSARDRGAVQPDGSIAFGTVTSTGNAGSVDDTIVLRITVAGDGTVAGQGVLQTSVSAEDPNAAGTRWTTTLTSTVPLETPNAPPSIAGASCGQNATNTMQIRPFAALGLSDPDPGQIETLLIHPSDPLFGTLSGADGLTVTAQGDYVLHGTVDQLQAAARDLLFRTGPGRSGVMKFGLTLDDGAGGVATDTTTSVNVAGAAPGWDSVQHFPLAASGSVVTSTADGTSTTAQVETYQGPVDYLQSQFIYDGTAPLAIVAQTPNMFIKSFAGLAAVELLSGQNVVDAGHGSNFLLGGTGQDVFYLDGRQLQETWDTIVGFHSGDIATLWGFQDGVSSYSWADNEGAAGYTGRTLHADLSGSGHIEASLTFTGATAADTGQYAITTGRIDGSDYMTIFAL